VPIQAVNYYSSPVHPPVAGPAYPLDPIPLPVEPEFPSIPGFDVPVPSAAQLQRLVEDAAQRRDGHEAELEALRQLGNSLGF
jgi:hypothetical protein